MEESIESHGKDMKEGRKAGKVSTQHGHRAGAAQDPQGRAVCVRDRRKADRLAGALLCRVLSPGMGSPTK